MEEMAPEPPGSPNRSLCINPRGAEVIHNGDNAVRGGRRDVESLAQQPWDRRRAVQRLRMAKKKKSRTKKAREMRLK